MSKCIFFRLDNDFTVCTQLEFETEHDWLIKGIDMMILTILLDYNHFEKSFIEDQEVGKQIYCFRQFKEHVL